MPDNLFGALFLSVINQTVVFIVLGFLALMIRAVARMVNAAETRAAGRQSQSPPMANNSGGLSPGVPSDADAEIPVRFVGRPEPGTKGGYGDLTIEEKVAAIGAVMAVIAGASGGRVFVRGLKDSGAWGKLGKARVMRERRFRCGPDSSDFRV